MLRRGGQEEDEMRAMLCSCHQHLEAPDEETLYEEVLAHLRRDHPVVGMSEAQIRKVVARHFYRYECKEVYVGTIQPDEEFGPEPY